MNSLAERKRIYNGYSIPCVGFGTWQTPSGDIAATAVKTAIISGYRHIDAAAAYGNEVSVGEGIRAGLREAGLERKDLFITSKVWNPYRGYQETKDAFERTLSDLGLDYLDLYLIHWPAAPHQMENWEEVNRETWRAMIELYKEGRIKTIGVSNFRPQHLKALMEMEVKPMVNQIEFHPGFMQEDITEYCRENDILIEAWSPLGTGRMLSNETLKEIASHYDKSVAQLCVRWALQNGVVPLPKSMTPERIIENGKVFDFEINEEDMKRINAMEYCGGSGLDPDKVSTLP